MDIKGKINLFINPHKRADGSTFNTYSTSIGGKDKEGNYKNLTLDVKFDGEEFPEEKLAKLTPENYYTLEIAEGFLSVREWADKAGELRRAPVVVISKAKITGKKEVKTSPADDLPF